MEVIKKDLKDIEKMVTENTKKIEENSKKIEQNVDRIINNMNKLHNQEEKINTNKEQIEKNTGALDILHTINDGRKKFYSMWIITFIALLISIGFNIFFIIKLLCR